MYLIHPTSMGIVDRIGSNNNIAFADYPATSNDQGEFNYNGTQYRMYRFFGEQAPPVNFPFKIISCK